MAHHRVRLAAVRAAPGTASAVAAPTVIFTIVSRNYIALAATLMQSLRDAHPDIARVIVLADEPWDFGPLDLAADLIDVAGLGAPEIANMKLWYDVLEFNTAVKPYAFLHLFRAGFGQAIYLDPDILVFRPLTEVLDGLAGHSLVLTPHISAPLPDEGAPTDLSIMKSGVWNCGFVALRNDADGQRLLRWWARRLLTQCRSDVANNLFTDQRWIDLAPCFVADVLRLRHPGYNLAYWNLPHRTLTRTASGDWRVDRQPLVFFHFSGFSIDQPASLSRYDTRHVGHAHPPLAALCELYAGRVRANGWDHFRQAPYAFARFPDGRPLEPPMRRWLLHAIDERRLDAWRPLAIASDYFDQPDGTVPGLTRLAAQLWRDRADLQRAFDLAQPSQLADYQAWLIGGEALNQGIGAASVQAQAALPPPGDLLAKSAHRARPPWPSVAEEPPDGGPDELPDAVAGGMVVATAARAGASALHFVRGTVVATLPDGAIKLDRQAALAWERRLDLALGFPLRRAEDVRAYLVWAMTQGIVEGAIDPTLLADDVIADLVRPTALTALYGDVPISLLMQLTSTIEQGRGRLNDHDRFPSERRGRLAHALWFAHIAPALFHWPKALFAEARLWLRHPSTIQCGDYPVSRGLLAVWELRADVQRNFPLDTPASLRAYLRWAAFEGLPDMGLAAASLDPGLLAFLAGPAELVEGVSEQVAIAYALRSDLQAAYDVDTAAGRAALRNWGERYFLAEYGARLGLTEQSPPPTPVTLHRTLALTGQWSVPSGRGEDIRGTAEALLAVGFTDFVIVDRDHARLVDPAGATLPDGARLVVDINLIHLNANTAYEDWRFLRRLGVAATRTISWWAWELERLPPDWRHAFAFTDEIWASTTFARAAFARERLRTVTQVPMTVSAHRPSPPAAPPRATIGIPPGNTLFLFAFDYRSYIARKNPEAVIAAFLEAFPTGTEPVSLLIKTQGAHQAAAAARRLRALCDDRRIILWDATLDRDAMLALVADCDAYVSLHRSEGFGRGPAEAMLLGKPVILTDYSGTRDFADATCARLVSCRTRPVAPGDYPGGEQQSWAEPSVTAAARAMRWVVENPAAAAALGCHATRRIAALYDAVLVGTTILRTLGLEERAAWRDQLAKAAAD